MFDFGTRQLLLGVAALCVLSSTAGCATATRALTGNDPDDPDPIRATVALDTYLTPRAERPTIFVMDFDYSAVVADLAPAERSGFATLVRAFRGEDVADQQERSESNLGAGISLLALDKMLEAGQFRIMERRALDDVLAEQQLANSGAADPTQSSVVQQAKLLGAQYMLTGAITQMGFEENTRGLALGGLGIPGVGAIGKKDSKTRVVITARLVDTSTGEIVLSATGEGISHKGGGFALGGAGVAGGLALGSNSSNVKESAIGEATDMAVHNLVVTFADRWSKVR